MRIILLLAVLLVGCGKSKCEKYAEMEIRCGGYPKDEEEITRKLAEGFCETTDTVDKSIAAPIEAAAECAAKYLKKDGADCHAYKQCKEAGRQ